ncbi:hypothetical protein ACFS07_33065 [Undibacterium arcticum]
MDYFAYSVGRLLGYFVRELNNANRHAVQKNDAPGISTSDRLITGGTDQVASKGPESNLANRLDRYRPAMIRIIPLQDNLGSINVSMYEQERRVERRLYINDAKLKAKVGFNRHDFPSWSLLNEGTAWSTEYIVSKKRCRTLRRC